MCDYEERRTVLACKVCGVGVGLGVVLGAVRGRAALTPPVSCVTPAPLVVRPVIVRSPPVPVGVPVVVELDPERKVAFGSL